CSDFSGILNSFGSAIISVRDIFKFGPINGNHLYTNQLKLQ
ncbi:18557_t:CDS:1, partial [Funneliformis geosporum]